MGEVLSATASPRRYEALAFIIERIVRDGTSPSYDEIADRLGVRQTRARHLVDQLVAEQLVERPTGKQRSLRVRDVTRSRAIVVDVLNRLGWRDALPLGQLQQARAPEPLARMPAFEVMPDLA